MYCDVPLKILIFTGNTTSQARHCLVHSNLIHGVGEILASSGGVLVSSGSYIHIRENTHVLIYTCIYTYIHIIDCK